MNMIERAESPLYSITIPDCVNVSYHVYYFQFHSKIHRQRQAVDPLRLAYVSQYRSLLRDRIH